MLFEVCIACRNLCSSFGGSGLLTFQVGGILEDPTLASAVGGCMISSVVAGSGEEIGPVGAGGHESFTYFVCFPTKKMMALFVAEMASVCQSLKIGWMKILYRELPLLLSIH